jgi:hypothetical protein
MKECFIYRCIAHKMYVILPQSNKHPQQVLELFLVSEIQKS